MDSGIAFLGRGGSKDQDFVKVVLTAHLLTLVREVILQFN